VTFLCPPLLAEFYVRNLLSGDSNMTAYLKEEHRLILILILMTFLVYVTMFHTKNKGVVSILL
jgi:hypothetical protein